MAQSKMNGIGYRIEYAGLGLHIIPFGQRQEVAGSMGSEKAVFLKDIPIWLPGSLGFTFAKSNFFSNTLVPSSLVPLVFS